MPRSTMIGTLSDLDYPDSDGKPLAETEFQFNPIVYAVSALRVHFQHRPDVHVGGNLLLYYEEGNRGAAVAPDVFVAFGVSDHTRRTWLLWREGKAPDFVLEVTSRSTRRVDQGRKRDLYARLGVSEYWQYDPTGDYLDPPLQGLILSGAQHGPALALERLGAGWRAYSPVLGLNVCVDEGALRFHDPLTGDDLLSHQESEQARQESEARFRESEQAWRESEQARRTEVRARQEAEARFRESEQARQEAEARLADLEARLRALQPPPGRPGRPDS